VGKILSSPRLLGVVFIALLLLAVYLTYATFTQKFSSYDRVTLDTDSVGLQLPLRADVKIRGVIVGEVLNTEAQGEKGAKITLGLYPDKMNEVPANVSGAIIPKTLFGEKYVSLEIPKSGPEGQLATGATITKSQTSIEVEQVLNDIYPLLRTIHPGDLDTTLTAISQALEGRGNELGQTLTTLDTYLKKLNPQIQPLLADLGRAAKVSNLYADILPQVSTILDNTVKTTGTLQQEQTPLNQTLRDLTSFSNTARTFLAQNADNLEAAGNLGNQILTAIRPYAATIPCTAEGALQVHNRLAQAFRGFELHIIVETLPHQPRAYRPSDRPHIGTYPGPKPSCMGLPAVHYSQAHPYPPIPHLNDGVSGPNLGVGNAQRPLPGFDQFGYHGTPDDVSTLRKLLRQEYGAPSSDDLDLLQAGPLAVGGGR